MGLINLIKLFTLYCISSVLSTQQHRIFFWKKPSKAWLEPRAAGSGSKNDNHWVMLPSKYWKLQYVLLISNSKLGQTFPLNTIQFSGCSHSGQSFGPHSKIPALKTTSHLFEKVEKVSRQNLDLTRERKNRIQVKPSLKCSKSFLLGDQDWSGHRNFNLLGMYMKVWGSKPIRAQAFRV